jgi:hypothetical protein
MRRSPNHQGHVLIYRWSALANTLAGRNSALCEKNLEALRSLPLGGCRPCPGAQRSCSIPALKDLAALLDAVPASGLAGRAAVCVGSYGVNRRAGDAVHQAGLRYAPMLALRNDAPSPLPSTAARRVAAGREAGRSFRDGMRSPLFPVETWQFEELSRGVASSRPLREFSRGVLEGMLHGRAGDRDISGFVWLAEGAFALPSRPVDAGVDVFWHVLGAAASHLVGEEFPAFVGDAAAAARRQDAGRRALAAGGPIRSSLADRYVAGVTPGVRLVPGLGGNVDGRPRTPRHLAAARPSAKNSRGCLGCLTTSGTLIHAGRYTGGHDRFGLRPRVRRAGKEPGGRPGLRDVGGVKQAHALLGAAGHLHVRRGSRREGPLGDSAHDDPEHLGSSG